MWAQSRGPLASYQYRSEQLPFDPLALAINCMCVYYIAEYYSMLAIALYSI